MRILQPDEARVRLGWLRPLARLTHEGVRGAKPLGAELLRRHEAEHHAWVAPASRFTRGLTEYSAEPIARAAQLYGLEIPEDSEFVPPLRAVLITLDPWPNGDSANPFVWDNGLAFVGLTASLAANGDLLIPLLSAWEDGSEPLPLLASVVDELLARSDVEHDQGLISAKKQLDTRHAPGSRAWKRVGRPWLEPLVELGLLRADAALHYALTPRGAALAARWRATPMPVEQRLIESLAEDWVFALGHTPREPTDEELLATLAACPNFGEPGERVARLEELAFWAQATWIRSAPGACASEPTLRRLLGRVGFAERAGVMFASGLMSYESYLRWTGPVEVAPPPCTPSQEDAPSESLGLAEGAPPATDARAYAEGDVPLDEVLRAAPSEPPSPISARGDAIELEPATLPSHFLAWRSYAIMLLETPGALAMGGPRLWLRQLGELLSDPAASHLIQDWRKESQWPRSDDGKNGKRGNAGNDANHGWIVEATLLAGLVELRNIKLARDLAPAHIFLDLLERWQNEQADLNRVRVLRSECERSLDDLQRSLLDVLRRWLQGEGQISDLNEWPNIRRITRWILADAALLGGHSRDALADAMQGLTPAAFDAFASGLTQRSKLRWVATQTVYPLGEGLSVALFKKTREDLTQGFAWRRDVDLKVQPGGPNLEQTFGWPGSTQLGADAGAERIAASPDEKRWTIEASIEASSEERAREQAVLLFSQVRARARLLLTLHGASSPQVHQGQARGEQLALTTDGAEQVEERPSSVGHGEGGDRKAPNPVELGFEVAPPPVDPEAYALFDDALLSLARAAEGEGPESTATQLTLIWVALEHLLPDAGRGRAGRVQEIASRLMARLALANEAGGLLRRTLAVMHEVTLSASTPDQETLDLWRVLYGEEVAQRYRDARPMLPQHRARLFGEALKVNDEDALVRLAKLAQAAPKDTNNRSEPLGELAKLVERQDALLALDLRALGRDLLTDSSLRTRLQAERLLLAGAMQRAYRARNRLVHASDTGLGEDRSLFVELRDHLIHKVDRLILALTHPRCRGMTLPDRWAVVQERLDRVQKRKDEKDGKAVTLPDLLARSAWGTSD